MIFDNTIGIGDIISSFALLCTFITISIMIKQRKDANRPYLVLELKDKFYSDFNIEPREVNYDECSFYNSLYKIDRNPFDFDIKNIGNGVAREINVSIKIENISIIKLDEKIFILEDCLVVECPEQESEGYLKNKPLENANLYFTNLASNDNISLSNSLKRFENTVNSIIYHYMSNDDLKSIQEKLIPSIQIDISYKNILNDEYNESYIIDINPGMWSSFLTKYTIKLKHKEG
ncbi:hypothetical protein [Paraclostridium sordellii]|uniref:hypothetical protein n=1 Tax=Paraclostridium sordellii TaxID=1505 RepID=UPI0022E87337|nr:hypothetical protein [Paeniclostridium sordellii]